MIGSRRADIRNLNITGQIFDIKARSGSWYLLQSVTPGVHFGVGVDIPSTYYCQFWTLGYLLSFITPEPQIADCGQECVNIRNELLPCTGS